MSDELRPCPFCGGKAALRTSWMADGHKYRAVECAVCGATTPGNYSEAGDQSAWDWNTRTPEQAIAATLGSGTCRLYYGEDDDGYDGWYCDECGGWFQAVRRDGHLVKPKHCQNCGKAVKR